MKWIRSVAVVVAVAGVVLSARTAVAAPDPAVLVSFDDLSAAIGAVPDGELNRGQKNAFAQRVANGQARIAQGLEQEGLSFVRRAIERLHELDDRSPRLPVQDDARPAPLAMVATAMAMARSAGAAADELS